jgi:hypothetical protein
MFFIVIAVKTSNLTSVKVKLSLCLNKNRSYKDTGAWLHAILTSSVDGGKTSV